jgi:hypothetical protein
VKRSPVTSSKVAAAAVESVVRKTCVPSVTYAFFQLVGLSVTSTGAAPPAAVPYAAIGVAVPAAVWRRKRLPPLSPK